MRAAGEGKKRPASVRFDEENLQANEIIKASLNCQPIDEPKTPYVRPMESEEGGMSPLSLENEGDDISMRERLVLDDTSGAESSGREGSASAHGSGYWASSEQSVEDEEGVVSDPTQPDSFVSNHTARFAELSTLRVASGAGGETGGASGGDNGSGGGDAGMDLHVDDVSVGHTHHDSRGPSSMDGDDAQHEDKRRCFEQHRKAHYDMKAAMQRGKDLLSEGEEEGGASKEGSVGRRRRQRVAPSGRPAPTGKQQQQQ